MKKISKNYLLSAVCNTSIIKFTTNKSFCHEILIQAVINTFDLEQSESCKCGGSNYTGDPNHTVFSKKCLQKITRWKHRLNFKSL